MAVILEIKKWTFCCLTVFTRFTLSFVHSSGHCTFTETTPLRSYSVRLQAGAECNEGANLNCILDYECFLLKFGLPFS